MTLLDSIQQDYAHIDKAAAEFLSTLPGENFTRVIALAAEIAGLQLLRATRIDLSQFPSGSALLGAVSDEAYEPMQRFVYGWIMSNGLGDTGAACFQPAGKRSQSGRQEGQHCQRVGTVEL